MEQSQDTSCDRKLLSQIQADKVADNGIATILQDIQKIASWFQMCSFGRLDQETDSLSHSLSKTAPLNFCDTEWFYTTPLC